MKDLFDYLLNNFSYDLFLLTFLGYPVVALVIANMSSLKKFSKFLWVVFCFFVVHNTMFFIGVSLKGDYPDYAIFSLEYLFVCLVSFSFSAHNIYIKIVRTIIIAGVLVGIAIGFIGIWMFIVFSQDYEADKIFHFTSYDKSYESRRYQFGFATMMDTRYTFDTYRRFSYLPFEKRIDKTVFITPDSGLSICEDSLIIYILKNDNQEMLVFKSGNGNKFTKPLQ